MAEREPVSSPMSETEPNAKPRSRAGAPVHRGPREDRGVVAAQILRAARTAFAANGYAATSLRSVARDAGVDPALVTYYFKSKIGLLDAALVPPPSWAEAVSTAAGTPIRTRGAALVRTMIDGWEQPETEEFLRSTILASAHEPIARQRLAANFAMHILDAVSSRIEDEERFLRASLAASQIVGVAMMRYVWQVGALATLPADQVVAVIAPTVQRYLNGKITP
jgi:AcrR family transcriptional regulator